MYELIAMMIIMQLITIAFTEHIRAECACYAPGKNIVVLHKL